MKVTLFTSNQPRHVAMSEKLLEAGFSVNVIVEAATISPGEVNDLHAASALHKEYFSKVICSERKFFGEIRSFSEIKNLLCIRMGEVNKLTRTGLEKMLDADIFLVFGASYIKGWLCDFLIENKALNIHMGASPYYRGSSCNFWAMYDDNPEYVGATIHLLSKGLDSGPIVRTCNANARYMHNAFSYTMSAVENIQNEIIDLVKFDYNYWETALPQDRSLEIRYSKKSEFTEEIIEDFFRKNLNPKKP